MKKLYKIITDALLIILIAFIAVIYLPKVIGIEPLQVLSGSMEPVYHVGSLVYVKCVEPSDINVGDVITFNLSENTRVTHRVVEKDDTSQTFKTKGDANQTPDGGSVSYNNVIGKVIFNIPLLGYAASFIGTTQGMIAMGALIITVLLLTCIPDMLNRNLICNDRV